VRNLKKPLIIVGIDLAGVESRRTGFCRLENLTARTEVLYTDKEIVEKMVSAKPEVVAIDAPLALPKERCCLEDNCTCRGKAHFRKCDLELRKMGIRFFPVTLGPMRNLTKRGIRLKKLVEDYGLEVIETYPGGAQDLWGIPRKSDIYGLKRGLQRLGVKGDINKAEISDHELDAITCSLVGRSYSAGNYLALGDPEEILMILPNKSTSG